MSPVQPVRLLIKSLILFMVADLAFAYLNPPVGRLSLFNQVIPGRLRFPAQQEKATFNNGILVFQDLNAMFATHVISAGPKPPDEYRVLFLGDSSIWGYNLDPEHMITQQINRLDLVNCEGKNIKAYNLSYPLPSFMRDLLILDHAMAYQPDLIVWPVTLLTFLTRSSDRSFLSLQPDRTLQFIRKYHLHVEAERYLRPATFWDWTLEGQRSRLKVIFTEQAYGLIWAATGLDTDPLPPSAPVNDQSPNPGYYDFESVSDTEAFLASLQFSALDAGRRLAGHTPVLFINEPIFIATGLNSNVRYNKYYPRWAYDEYRARIAEWMTQPGCRYVDLWNAIPAADFIGSPLHLNEVGEQQLAGLLAGELATYSCP